MPREFTRGRRVEEQIQRIVSDLLRREIRDPRLRQLIVTDVSVSRDLGVAWIYYTGLGVGDGQGGDSAEQDRVAEGLERVRRLDELIDQAARSTDGSDPAAS